MSTVALAIPCYVSALRPGEAAHARRLLEALGDDVETLEGLCCGQPAFNSGFRNRARSVGRHFLRALRPHETVVMPSGSCVSMLYHYLPGLFGPREAAVAALTGRVRELCVYVAGHPRLYSLPLHLEGTVAYHDPCHARRELGQTQATLGLLGRVQGLEVRRLAHEEECCGFGGAFSLKQPEVSNAMAATKLADIAATSARVLVSPDLSCLAQIESAARGRGLRLEGWTVAELLSRALP